MIGSKEAVRAESMWALPDGPGATVNICMYKLYRAKEKLGFS